MFRKQKGLAVNRGKLAKIYIIENTVVTLFAGARRREKGELKMKASLAMLLKTNREKMSAFRSLAMLMKTS
jgi:hypothetical protein